MSAREAISSVGSVLSDELWCLFAEFIPSLNIMSWSRTLVSAAALALPASGLNVVPRSGDASAVFDAFVSYSLEFAFFPDFAGGFLLNLISPWH